MRIVFLFLLFVLVSCDDGDQDDASSMPPAVVEIVEMPELQAPKLVLAQRDFDILPGWKTDDFQTFALAFSRTCVRILKTNPDNEFGVLVEAGANASWQKICEKFISLEDKSAESIRVFLEVHFVPYAMMDHQDPEGLFTGYYEASLRGSLTRGSPYVFPLHKRPDDLVMVQLGEFREELKGQRIAGRVVGGNLVPYESREEIVAGRWPHEDEVLVWVDDPVDAFFVQIQGSGIVEMDDGQVMRIGYAGQNGHPYYAIGRELVERGEMSKEEVSMQSIRQWLSSHPALADEIMNTNKSYVFFQEIDGDGPIGGEGIALTAGRSLAVDRSLIPYGVPLWVDIERPDGADKDIQRLMVAQDTGGAIRGPVRGDVFWGYGDLAEDFAGKMNSRGQYWILLPRLDSEFAKGIAHE